LWHLGYPDQAFKVGRDARELARHVRSPFSLVFALYNVNWVLQLCRLGAEALAAAEEQISLATEQGFAWWLATGTIYRGAALLLQGRLDEALPVFLKGLDAYRATGSGMALPYYHSILVTHTHRPVGSETHSVPWMRVWSWRRKTTTVLPRPSCTASKESCS
jgi:hypothetical protein